MLPDNKLEQELKEQNIDAVVASSRENTFYLTGTKLVGQWIMDSTSYCLGAPDLGRVLIVPPVSVNQIITGEREIDEIYSYGNYQYYRTDELSETDQQIWEASTQQTGFESPERALAQAITDLIGMDARIGIETEGLAGDALDELFQMSQVSFVSADDSFTRLRRRKSPEEIYRLRQSATIAERAIERSLEYLEPGLSESEFAAIVQTLMLEEGAYQVPIPNVSFGENTAHALNLPYNEFGIKGTNTLQAGDLIRFDTGCVYQGYWSDIARTYVYRDAPRWASEYYDIIFEVNETAIEAFESTTDTAEIYDRALRKARALGEGTDTRIFRKFDRHHFGHAIGVDVYDSPVIGPEPNRIKTGMVFEVETPVYQLGRGGMNVEDTICTTDSGFERWTTYPDELRIVG